MIFARSRLRAGTLPTTCARSDTRCDSTVLSRSPPAHAAPRHREDVRLERRQAVRSPRCRASRREPRIALCRAPDRHRGFHVASRRVPADLVPGVEKHALAFVEFAGGPDDRIGVGSSRGSPVDVNHGDPAGRRRDQLVPSPTKGLATRPAQSGGASDSPSLQYVIPTSALAAIVHVMPDRANR